MTKMNIKPTTISNFVLQHISDIEDIGLFNGKMGISIYLFHLYKKTENSLYKQQAEALIDDIWQKATEDILDLDFEKGLAGIAWGIEYLVQEGFLEADTDEILGDLDDRLFKHLTNQKVFSVGLQNGLIGFGFYLLSRLKGKELSNASDRNFLLKRLIMELIDRLYKMIEEVDLDLKEPIKFRIDWPLPLLIILLVEARKLNFYNSKIDIILEELSANVLSMFPIKMSNRLYLLTGMTFAAKHVGSVKWDNHIDMLRNNIDYALTLSEFPNKNIAVSNGLSGISICLMMLAKTSEENEIKELLQAIGHQVLESDLWSFFLEEDKFHSRKLGLYDGVSGIGYSTLHLF